MDHPLKHELENCVPTPLQIRVAQILLARRKELGHISEPVLERIANYKYNDSIKVI